MDSRTVVKAWAKVRAWAEEGNMAWTTRSTIVARAGTDEFQMVLELGTDRFENCRRGSGCGPGLGTRERKPEPG